MFEKLKKLIFGEPSDQSKKTHSVLTCGHFLTYGPVGCSHCVARDEDQCDGWIKREDDDGTVDTSPGG